MIIRKLVAENFQSYSNCGIDFSKISLAGIVGNYDGDSKRSNGSGKSSIMDMIIYSLYGKGRMQSEDDLINEYKNSMRVEFDFSINEKEIKIIRDVENNKRSLKLYVNGKDFSEKKLETQDKIIKILGMDYELFIATVFFKQDKNDNFTSASPTIRKEYLKNLLNLSFWDKCLEKTKIKIKKIEDEKLIVETKLNELKKKIENTNEDELKKEFENKKEELNYCLLIEKNEENKKKKIEIEKMIKYFENEIKEKTEKVNEYKNKLKEIPKIEYSYNIDELEKKIEDIKEKRHDVEKKALLLNSEVDRYNNELSQMEDLTECPVCKRQIDIEFKNDFKEKFLAKRKSSEDELKKYNDELILLKSEFKKSYDLYSNAKEEKQKMFKVESEREIFKVRISQYNDDIKKIEKNIFEKKESIDKIEILDCENKNYNKPSILYRIEEIKNILKNFDDDKKELSSLSFEMKSILKNIKIFYTLKDVFGKNGIVAEIMKFSIDEIENGANKILNDIGIEKQIKFETNKELKSKKEIVDSLEILITSKGKSYRLYESFSGGQKTVINFAIRLAMTSYLLEKKSIWLGVIFLDEVFGSLDEYNRNQIIKVINYLKNKFDQIFVISHTEIQDVFPNLIKVKYNSKKEESEILEVL